jgi:hypothetical protein
MRRTMLPVVLALLLSSPVAAQRSLALGAGPRDRDPSPVVSHALHAAMLKPLYQLRLVSDWPQLSGGGLGCVNGGQEVLEGRLVQRSDGGYAGQLIRKATIRFCGVHGAAQEACALTLTSEGTVSARGEVFPAGAGWTTPEIELRWQAMEGAADAVVEGDCTSGFSESVRRMYLGASHSLEFPLPLAGEGRRTTRLDDYGWIVDVK